ncbi:PP_RS20740 family protein [Klebsiella pneumoniae]|uniref:PP_RS20740 family protein n=1 Tax=Klebsiella pneumoniae TaxID=573 RepID=UPI000E2D5E46|nr:hypothetical protein [Klebsiella pneumoniae]SYO47173.1 Uncharacterised protein [Klebsiella pneumoniae]HBX8276139.1 hypothetical protein [Klebsiella pneumoniae]HBZ7521076.1 hypothetical protein [Klebsiella pneumoniae]HBZ7719007.1 hypothetical protein [Klebsiella pneumoniae]
MHDSDQNTDDLLLGILDDVEIEPMNRMVKSNFEAWHLPRKQYVRVYQWIFLINRYRAKLLRGCTTLKYLSLPGDDLLDLRVLHEEFCSKTKITLEFLGFNKYPRDINNPRNNDVNLSLVEVKEKQYISPTSDILNNDIRLISNKTSTAYKETSERGPYDVINLDFCDSIFSKQSESHNTHALLREIIYIQSSRRRPWLMFITTRVGESYIDRETLDKLMACFQDNLKNDVFSSAAKEKLSISGFSDVSNALKQNDSHINITLISLLKWLLSYALSFKPAFKIELCSTMTYVVDINSPGVDLVSFALIFTPIDERPEDKFSLISSEIQKVPTPSEPELAVEFITNVLKKTNCDIILQDNQKTWDNMLSQTEKLLSESRYVLAKYKDWLKTHFSTPT